MVQVTEKVYCEEEYDMMNSPMVESFMIEMINTFTAHIRIMVIDCKSMGGINVIYFVQDRQ